MPKENKLETSWLQFERGLRGKLGTPLPDRIVMKLRDVFYSGAAALMSEIMKGAGTEENMKVLMSSLLDELIGFSIGVVTRNRSQAEETAHAKDG